MEVLVLGIFKKSKVIRKSDEPLNKTETKWFKGQKVKIKTGTTSSRPKRKNYRNNRSNNQTWFKEEPLPVPNVEKKQMLISFKGGSSKIAILEGASLVEYYSAQNKKQSLVGNIYLGKVKNILPGMEAAFVSFGEEKNGVIYVADITNSKRNSKIEHLLKPEQEILVQVVKDAMGEKGARLTGQISFPGRYLVLIPNSNTKGISRRLPEQERSRLDRIIRKIKPEGFGVIVRTAAEGVSETSLKNDIDKLADEWAAVSSSNQGTAPVLIHEEPDVSIKVIREHLNFDFKKLLIEYINKHTNDPSSKPLALISGGETVVNMTGSGKGGRNQELALSFLANYEKIQTKREWLLLSVGTDGIDGPTDAAGGIIDSISVNKMDELNLDVTSYLDNNDSYNFLKEVAKN